MCAEYSRRHAHVVRTVGYGGVYSSSLSHSDARAASLSDTATTRLRAASPARCFCPALQPCQPAE